MAKAVGKILSPVTSVLGIGGKEKDPIAAPDPDSIASRIANERKNKAKFGNTGRASTVLDSGKLG